MLSTLEVSDRYFISLTSIVSEFQTLVKNECEFYHEILLLKFFLSQCKVFSPFENHNEKKLFTLSEYRYHF